VSSINVGARFVKTGDVRKNIWVVTKAWTHVDGILHVRLAKSSQETDVITVSARTLYDTNYFKPITLP
jgi:hypothetical protein